MNDHLHGIDKFVQQVRADFTATDPEYSQLQPMGQALKSICMAKGFATGLFRQADPGEELMYPLSVDPNGGPSAYLVSDGIGVDTPPHDHHTWAVIVGLRGTEYHLFYRRLDNTSHTVINTAECAVATGDILVMEKSEVHAIDAGRGQHPTWHVHLYGRAQSKLPDFASRCYEVSGS